MIKIIFCIIFAWPFFQVLFSWCQLRLAWNLDKSTWKMCRAKIVQNTENAVLNTYKFSIELLHEQFTYVNFPAHRMRMKNTPWFLLNSRFSEKATKIRKNLPLVLTLLSKCCNRWEIFSNFVAFSQCLNFKLLNHLGTIAITKALFD